MILNHLIVLAFIAVLFILCAYLSQKTDKEFIINAGIVLLIFGFLTVLHFLLNLINLI